MKVVIVNGRGGAGKDAFCHLCSEITGLKCMTYSTITRIKYIARQLGWNDSKDDKGRKFLSDLKAVSNSYSDYLFQCACDDIGATDAINGIEVVFVMCREPKEIEKFKEKFNATTILIKNKRLEQKVYGNNSDDKVDNYTYDYYIHNDGSMDELRDWAKWFLTQIGVKIDDKWN